VNIVAGTLFAVLGGFREYISASIGFNLVNLIVGQSSIGWKIPGVNLEVGIPNIYLYHSLLIMSSFVIMFSLFYKKAVNSASERYFYTLTILAIILEILFSGISGKEFKHYILVLLPLLSLPGAFIADWLQRRAKKFQLMPVNILNSSIIFIMLLIPLSEPARSRIPTLNDFFLQAVTEKARPSPEITNEQILAVLEYFEKHEFTRKNPYLIMWGNSAEYYLLTNKIAPTRFFYQVPLYTAGYSDSSMRKEFLVSLREFKPLILDASVRTGVIPWIGGLAWHNTDGMKQVNEYILNNYTRVTGVGPQNFPLYVHNSQYVNKNE